MAAAAAAAVAAGLEGSRGLSGRLFQVAAKWLPVLLIYGKARGAKMEMGKMQREEKEEKRRGRKGEGWRKGREGEKEDGGMVCVVWHGTQEMDQSQDLSHPPSSPPPPLSLSRSITVTTTTTIHLPGSHDLI